jgi:hypothetical protein
MPAREEEPTRPERRGGVRVCVVEVRRGESNAEAWARHLGAHPGDAEAEVRIFHRQEHDSGETPKSPRPAGGGGGLRKVA